MNTYNDQTQSSSHNQDQGQLDQNERWISIAAGGALLAWMTPRSVLRYLALPTIGSYLVYRGLTGRCPVSEATGTSLSQLADKVADFGKATSDSIYRNPYAEPGAAESHRAEDPIDEALQESFPASDPPSYSPSKTSEAEIHTRS